MSRVGVEGCVTAIVSAFHAAAESVQDIKSRKEKKTRKKEHDVEEIMEAKLLHKSLLESAKQCRLTSTDRQEQYRSAFSVGDGTATAQLKDVVVGIMIDLVQTLQTARAAESAVLDLTSLYGASVTYRNDALRTMDELCRRITTNMASYELPVHQNYSPRQYDYLTEPTASQSVTSTRHELYGPAASSHTYARNSIAMSTQSGSDGNSTAIRQQTFQTLRRPSGGWSNHQPLHATGSAKDEMTDVCSDSMSELSLQDSAIGSEMPSPAPLERPRTCSIAEQSLAGSMFEPRSPHSLISRINSSNWDTRHNDEDDVTTDAFTRESLSSRRTSLVAATDVKFDHVASALSAPEVVPKEFEPLSQQKYFCGFSPQPDNIWEPLSRPAQHNNYHGFCKGAWQARKSLGEGINTHFLPNANNVNVPHWCCKVCTFRAQGTNEHALPEQIFFNNRRGVRYRWAFLAKSHVAAVGTFQRSEDFAYGCIFCAAEGRTTARYEKLDKLMEHIVARHKTTILTAETKEKTRCVVGCKAKREEDWDIDLPETKHRGAGTVMQEFVVSAVTGISNYGQ